MCVFPKQYEYMRRHPNVKTILRSNALYNFRTLSICNYNLLLLLFFIIIESVCWHWTEWTLQHHTHNKLHNIIWRNRYWSVRHYIIFLISFTPRDLCSLTVRCAFTLIYGLRKRIVKRIDSRSSPFPIVPFLDLRPQLTTVDQLHISYHHRVPALLSLLWVLWLGIDSYVRVKKGLLARKNFKICVKKFKYKKLQNYKKTSYVFIYVPRNQYLRYREKRLDHF